MADYLLTGNAGETVRIVGENFYRVDEVKFGAVDATSLRIYALPVGFDLCDAVVPANATYGKVKIISTLRGVTGYSLTNFIPTPVLTGLIPATGTPGSTIRLLGRGFSVSSR